MDMEERISCRAASMYSCNQDFVCDIDSLIIDPLLSVNFRTMCQKTLGSGGTQHRPFGNLGHKVLPLQALMGDIEIIVTASKGL